MSEKNFALRRTAAAVALGVTAIGLVGAAHEAMSSSNTKAEQVDLHSPDAFNQLVKSGDWSGKIVVRTSESDRNPIIFANHLGVSAENHAEVTEEVSGQVGGAGDFEAGEVVVLEKDKVDMSLLAPMTEEQGQQLAEVTGDNMLTSVNGAEIPYYEITQPTS